MNTFEQNTNEKKPQELDLERLLTKVDYIVDGLKRHVDQGIKESVAVFMAHGFPTDDSCEGHMPDKDYKEFLYPRIGIYEPAPQNWKKDKKAQAEWRKANEAHQARINELLDEFYDGQKIEARLRLTFEPIGIFGGFRIVSAEALDKAKKDHTIEDLQQYQEEMEKFTVFLRDKYLNAHT